MILSELNFLPQNLQGTKSPGYDIIYASSGTNPFAYDPFEFPDIFIASLVIPEVLDPPPNTGFLAAVQFYDFAPLPGSSLLVGS